MKILIIQENGHHAKNLEFRECFCLQRAFESLDVRADVWGFGHKNWHDVPDWESYDLIFNIENFPWVPDLTKVKTKKFMWAIDAHVKGPDIYHHTAFTQKYDLVLHSTPEFCLENMVWFPNCYDDSIIFPLEIEKKYEVGFCGNKVNRKPLIDILKANVANFSFDEFVIGHDMVKAINSYKIHWNANIGIDINYRNFETMGCKTMLLTSNNNHYNELGMIDGENCVIYSSIIDMLTKISYYVKNQEQRERIATAGYQLVKNKHTYKNRAKQILELL